MKLLKRREKRTRENAHCSFDVTLEIILATTFRQANVYGSRLQKSQDLI